MNMRMKHRKRSPCGFVFCGRILYIWKQIKRCQGSFWKAFFLPKKKWISVQECHQNRKAYPNPATPDSNVLQSSHGTEEEVQDDAGHQNVIHWESLQMLHNHHWESDGTFSKNIFVLYNAIQAQFIFTFCAKTKVMSMGFGRVRFGRAYPILGPREFITLSMLKESIWTA